MEGQVLKKPARVRTRAVEWAGRPGGPCAKCGAEVAHLELDHVVPFFEGGRHHLSNIQWLCHACHASKSKSEVARHRAANPDLYKRTMSDERKAAVGAFFRGRPKTAEQQEKISAGLREAWAKKTPEERQAIFEKSAAKQRGRKVGPMPEERRRKIGEAQRRAWASGRRGEKSVGP